MGSDALFVRPCASCPSGTSTVAYNLGGYSTSAFTAPPRAAAFAVEASGTADGGDAIWAQVRLGAAVWWRTQVDVVVVWWQGEAVFPSRCSAKLSAMLLSEGLRWTVCVPPPPRCSSRYPGQAVPPSRYTTEVGSRQVWMMHGPKMR